MEGKDGDGSASSKFQIERVISLFEKNADVSDAVNRSKRAASFSFVEKHYKMDHPSRGKAIIFNHFRFQHCSERKGTESDVKNLTKALLGLGFRQEDIIVHRDLMARDIAEELKKVQKEDHTDRDLLMVFVLSHGNCNDRVSAFDVDYATETLWSPFTADKCQTLAGKPKIFFIIACRGMRADPGQKLLAKENESVTEVDARPIVNSHSYSIPTYSDFLNVFSTYKGYLSYRHKEEGTWYIQAFCEELSKTNISQISFTDFLAAVNGRLSMFFETLDSKKQTPIFSSTLTKGLYFTTKAEKPQAQ